MDNEDTILPAGRFNVAPFGPTGVINNNSLETVGQGLKKVFAPPIEMPRQFNAGPSVSPREEISPSGSNNDGGGGGVEGATLKEFLVCEDGEPVTYNFYIQ